MFRQDLSEGGGDRQHEQGIGGREPCERQHHGKRDGQPGERIDDSPRRGELRQQAFAYVFEVMTVLSVAFVPGEDRCRIVSFRRAAKAAPSGNVCAGKQIRNLGRPRKTGPSGKPLPASVAGRSSVNRRLPSPCVCRCPSWSTGRQPARDGRRAWSSAGQGRGVTAPAATSRVSCADRSGRPQSQSALRRRQAQKTASPLRPPHRSA